jgi:hypothetical protein
MSNGVRLPVFPRYWRVDHVVLSHHLDGEFKLHLGTRLITEGSNILSAPQVPMIYISNSIGRLLDLRTQQEEESDKQDDYVLLQLWLNSGYWILPDPDADHDCFMTPSKIPPSKITVLGLEESND